MIKNPKVSIIIPTYNEERNIELLLKSIQDQTYKNIEVIVVDDGSDDNTVKIAKSYSKNVFSRKHAERSVQRNFGAKKAVGQYLVFLDADMQLTPKVVEDLVKIALKGKHKVLVIPEKTIGNGVIVAIRRFEREMYEGDLSIEVARFFEKDVFNEFGGYDTKLTGPEDYDLPHRISRKYSIGRTKEYLRHNESGLTLVKLLKKKFYYASNGALYATKHPELIGTQGNLFFRKAYLKNWKKFVSNPILGGFFLLVRALEAAAAVLGFISAVGVVGFLKTFLKMFNK